LAFGCGNTLDIAAMTNAVNTVAQVIIAFCAFAALCLNFWKAPKPIDEKLLILRSLVELTAIAALVATGYFMIFTDRTVPVMIFAVYYLLVRYAVFAVSPDSLTRMGILVLATAAVFAGTAPFFQIQKASLNTVAKVQSAMIKDESRIISILERLVMPTASPSPSTTPHNP